MSESVESSWADLALPVHGRLYNIPGLTIIPPASLGGPSWAKLDVGDYRMRRTGWIRQIILHTTKGMHPQKILSGAGPGGADKVVADFWRGDPQHSAAQIVVDTDGSIVCLCDVGHIEAYHAEGSNPWSVGIEMYQVAGGGLYEATLDATVKLVDCLCDALGIPRQIPSLEYFEQPLRRMAGSGGPDCVGVFGHRHNTNRRGRGDPGDEIFRRLAAAGFEALDYDRGQDLEVSRARQLALNAYGERLTVDGICGPASMAAMRRQGFAQWRDVA